MVRKNTAIKSDTVIYFYLLSPSLYFVLSLHLQPQPRDLISSHSLLSHSLVAVSTGDTLTDIFTFTHRIMLHTSSPSHHFSSCRLLYSGFRGHVLEPVLQTVLGAAPSPLCGNKPFTLLTCMCLLLTVHLKDTYTVYRNDSKGFV